MKTNRITWIAASVIASAPISALAADPTGPEIMSSVENRADGKDQISTVTMEVKPERGTAQVRKFTFMRKTFDDHRKYVTFFIAPPDVRNSAFLEWDMQKESDRRWLYLPALGQVRRLTTGDERNAFFGSDFVYEDVTNRDPDLDEHKLTGSEKVKQWECWVIESTPKDAGKVDFTKYKTWVWKETPIIVKQEYYDNAGKVFKVFEQSSLQQIQGIWGWHQATMTNLKSNSKTKIELSAVKYNTSIPDENFTERQISRGAPQ
jgi:outer membrane lipoprotein-sorting protein